MLSKVLQLKLVEGRDCGDCAVCCEIFSIDAPELTKPVNVLCPHSIESKCAIYSTRPDICKNWFCLWRSLDDLPALMRPNVSGILVSLQRRDPPATLFERFHINVRVLKKPEDFDTEPVKAMITSFIEDGNLPVWISFEDTKRRIYPGPQFADAIENPTTTRHQDLVHMAQAWLKNYESLI